MREIRLYGSEGGGAAGSPYPYHSKAKLQRLSPQTPLNHDEVSFTHLHRASVGAERNMPAVLLMPRGGPIYSHDFHFLKLDSGPAGCHLAGRAALPGNVLIQT